MDQQYSVIDEQKSGLSYRFHRNIAENLQRYRELNTAVSLGQKEKIKLLLEECDSVNHHLLYMDLETPLHSSVHLGDVEVVRQLLSEGASVNAVYAFDTPLTLAAKFGKNEITDLLLLTSGLKNLQSADKISHFHVACMRNQVDVAKKLVLDRQDVNAAVSLETDYWPGFTPLHFAVQFQCTEVVEFLLNVGADITVKDVRQLTPLHLANMLRNTQIIDMILSAHMDIVANPVDSRGFSHFHIACTRNEPKIVEYFIKLGVNLEAPILEKSTQWQKKTAIDLAIHYKCPDVVRLLLRSGVPVRSPHGNRFQRLRDAHCTGNKEIVELLTSSDRLNNRCTEIEKFSDQFQSLIHGSYDTIKGLLTQSPEVLDSSLSGNGCTLLHVAIGLGREQVSKLILDLGADYTIQNFQGKTPLHLAFERNMLNLVKVMLDSHQNFINNPIDKDGLSHLHIACARNHVTTVKHLLKHGANVNSPVNFHATFWPGFTPLHFVAEFRSFEVTDALLESGASYSATNASDMSAFDIACTQLQQMEPAILYTQFCPVMTSILKFHSSRKDDLFNDRGFSLLHLESYRFNSLHSESSTMIEAVHFHQNHINKAIHKMNTPWDGYTPLHVSVQTIYDGNYAKLLTSEGADIFKQALNGNTPLHMTTSLMASAESTIDTQDRRFLQLNYIGPKGMSIFHTACAQANLDAMKYFLKHGVDPDCPSLMETVGCDFYAPLHIIVWEEPESYIDAAKLLLDHGANPNVKDFQGDTPLHLVGNDTDSKIIDTLVDGGADVNARNAFYETPLMSTFNEDYFGFIDSLNSNIASFLYNGADINLADERGVTPLSIDYVNDLPLAQYYPEFFISIDNLLAHVVKLKTIGFYVSDTNIKAYDFILRHFSDKLHFVEKSFSEKCIRELEVLKQIGIDSYTTLYDILFENSNRSAVSSQNREFQRVIDSEDFRERYPIYGFMLRLQFKRGQVRWPLLNESRKILCDLLDISLPRDCTERILQHLDNEDLEKIIQKKRDV